MISNYSKISLYQHHLTKSQNKSHKKARQSVSEIVLLFEKD
ncbi:UNVERIFIED_ORG: hypothetical protein QQG_6942 [Clostridioides difficile Y384]